MFEEKYDRYLSNNNYVYFLMQCLKLDPVFKSQHTKFTLTFIYITVGIMFKFLDKNCLKKKKSVFLFNSS